ncbi:MAG: glycosyltransferase family 2 protein [Acidobacteriia bacterium]|nr:glycosyltransferase family 2 protein [Terriglobia bacterium]
MSDFPLISIAMPVFNCAATVGTAVRSLLRQHYANWELIVLDDGSTDGTLDIVRRFSDDRIVCIDGGRRRGMAARLNEIIKLSRGEFFARMDGDDVAYPERLGVQIAYLQQNPAVAIVGSAMLVFGKEGVPIGKRGTAADEECRPSLMRSIPVGHPTFFGRTAWFRDNQYDETALAGSDQCLLLRTGRLFKIHVLSEVLLGYREEKLSLRKQVNYRACYFKGAKRFYPAFGVLPSAILLISQVGKICIDCLAIASGLNYKILRHRARPLSNDEVARWWTVWGGVDPGRSEGGTAL